MAAVGIGAAPAQASFPGGNGAITYASTPSVSETAATTSGKGALRSIGAGSAPDRLFRDDPVADEFSPAYSPDGKTLAWTAISDDQQADGLYVGPAAGGAPKRILTSSFVEGPSWSPDGLSLVYADQVEGIKVLPVDGASVAKVVLPASAKTILGSPIYSRDSASILFTRATVRGTKVRAELWTVGTDGASPRKLLGKSKGGLQIIGQPDLSPDGSRLTFVASGTAKKDRSKVYVAAADGSGVRAIVKAPANGVFNGPVWSPDGKTILVSRLRTTGSRGSATLLTYDATTRKQRVVLAAPRGYIVDPTWQPLP